MSRLFGTDGVRGVANKELTPLLAMQLGQAGASVLTKETSHKPTIMVGCDTRISGDMLANALMAGVCSVGANAVYVGIVPTPAVAYLTRKNHMDAGVVISASHNPVEFNGIKFFDANGYKLPDAMEDEIEAIIKNDMKDLAFPTGTEIGSITYRTDAREDYVKHATEAIPVDLHGMKIVADCAEGASYYTSVEALKLLGADVVAIHNNPDGTNINAGCGSTHMEELMERVKAEKADVGLAFDGDADRMLAVDENGKVIDGDLILYICGKYLMEQGRLEGNTIVTTVMSNLGLYKACDKIGMKYEQTAVGDKYVYENMLKNGYILGGEQSGHIIFSKHATTGDGMLTAIMLMEVILEKKQSLHALCEGMKMYPQYLENVRVSDKKAVTENPAVQKKKQEIEEELAGNGRIILRESGTEPVIRVMAEADSDELCRKYVGEMVEVIKTIL